MVFAVLDITASQFKAQAPLPAFPRGLAPAVDKKEKRREANKKQSPHDHLEFE